MLNHFDETLRYQQRMVTMAEEQYYRQMREAATLLSSGDGKNAAVLLERLYELRPDDVDVATNLGAAYILSKQYKRAIPVLEAAANAADSAVAWVNLAAAYLGALPLSTREEQDKAIAAYERALAIDPRYPNAHYNLGLIYEEQRDWSHARQMFEQALRVNSSDNDARTLLARVQRRLEDERSE
jgi:tetratricopeptide (TPR) repeat protein